MSTSSKPETSDIEKYLYYPEMAPRRPVNMGLLRVLAVILVIGGVAGVYYAAVKSPMPIVPIRDLENNILMNYATVYIEGIVTSPPRVDISGGKLRLTIYVRDNSSPTELPIYAYDPLASEILKQGVDKLPFIGDRVRLLIQVRVREDYTYAYLQDARGIYILSRPIGERVYVDSLVDTAEYSYVCSKGTVSNPRNVSAGLLFDIRTATGTVTVLVPNALYYAYSNELVRPIVGNLSLPGTYVDLCGVVYYYRGTNPEIVVRELEEVRLPVVQPVLFTVIDIRDVPNYINKDVSITGLFYAIYYSAGTYYVEIRSTDEGFAVNVTMSRDQVISLLNPATVGWKTLVRINGTVTAPSMLRYVAGEVLEKKDPLTVTVADALSHPVGRPLRIVNATVTSSSTVGAGNWRIYIRDASGATILVFVPSSTVRELGISLPRPGTVVDVAGYRAVYRGEQEVVVISREGLVIRG
jgi:DNA/RNA endonuclease YhcR with UshA esterase domain